MWRTPKTEKIRDQSHVRKKKFGTRLENQCLVGTPPGHQSRKIAREPVSGRHAAREPVSGRHAAGTPIEEDRPNSELASTATGMAVAKGVAKDVLYLNARRCGKLAVALAVAANSDTATATQDGPTDQRW